MPPLVPLSPSLHKSSRPRSSYASSSCVANTVRILDNFIQRTSINREHAVQCRCQKRNGPAGVGAPRDPAHRERMTTVDEKSLAQGERTVRVEQDQEHEQKQL